LLIDRDGTILSINESGARRFRSTPDVLIGRNAYEVLPTVVSPRRRAHIDQVFRTGEAVRFEDQHEGTLFANSIYPVLPPKRGEVTSVADFAEDITAQKQAEDEQRKSEQFFRGLMEQSPLAIEVLTPDGRIREVNDAWMRLWGFNEEEADAGSIQHAHGQTDGRPRSCGEGPEGFFRGSRSVASD
jgi:PAS domain S-box-containing protein